MPQSMRQVTAGPLVLSNDLPLTIIAGPCQLETKDHALMIAERMAEACAEAGAGYVFKGSFDKANRTSLSGARGVGLAAGLEILATVRAKIGCPVLTDVHAPEQCDEAAAACDILQIPAFLCRQTDLLLAAGETKATVNIKKGQFLAPWDMPHAIAKLEATSNTNILLTERGTSFGYNTLVTDMRALPEMMRSGYPVIMDATHAVQQPGGQGSASGGQRALAPVLARAAVSIGIAGVFIETHESPDIAPSDGPTMVALEDMPALVKTLMQFDALAKATPIRL